jgi:hypothetical protein
MVRGSHGGEAMTEFPKAPMSATSLISGTSSRPSPAKTVQVATMSTSTRSKARVSGTVIQKRDGSMALKPFFLGDHSAGKLPDDFETW